MRFLTFIIFILLVNYATSQVQNSTFSDWEDLGSYDKPTSWFTDQNELDPKIYRVEESGEIWAKFLVDYPSGFECSASMWQSFDKTDILPNNELFFDLKALSLNIDSTVFFRVQIIHYNKDDVVEIQSMDFDTLTQEFTTFSIPIDKVTSDSLEIRFRGGGTNVPFGTGCTKLSEHHLDNVRFKLSSRTTGVREIDIEVYPNPVTDFLNIQAKSRTIEKIEIMNNSGQIKFESLLSKAVFVGDLPAGNYFLRVNNEVIVPFIKL